MKKTIFFTLPLFFCNLCFSQVGIGTESPQATLDIKGNLRIETRVFGENDQKMLTVSEDGIVNEKLINDISIRKYRIVQQVKSGETIVIRNPQAYNESNLTVSSRNPCGRSMITTFVTSGGAIALTGGIARDKIAEYTIQGVSSGESSYSPRLMIKFDNVLACRGSGSTQFDYSIKKLNDSDYEITNNGNVEREYEITWMEI